MVSDSLSIKQSGLRWLWLAVLIFIADIVVKYAVMHNMGYGWEHRIEITSFFNLLYVHNHGAAFSFLSDQGGWQRWLFTLLAFGFSVLLMVWLRRQPRQMLWSNLAYVSIIGGAIGNAFDRMVHGYVIDYLDFYWGSYHWPAFNIADIAIVVGAIMMVLEGLISKETDKAE